MIPSLRGTAGRGQNAGMAAEHHAPEWGTLLPGKQRPVGGMSPGNRVGPPAGTMPLGG